MNDLPSTPRKIDPAKTFASIVNWIEDQVVEHTAPGLIVGVSGTDSILAFLASARAFEKLGRPHRVLGVNSEHQPPAPNSGGIQCVSGEFNWVAQDIFPWLRQQAPQAQLEIDRSLLQSDDNLRWGRLFSRAVRDTYARNSLNHAHYFTVGTRNATEEALGTYSQASKAVSMLPLIQLYKSEILEICEYLNIPQIALQKSREVDCDCGRFETQAHYLRELDLFLMHKAGLLSRDYLKQNVPDTAMNAIYEFYAEETYRNEFRSRTPYRPAANLVQTCG